MTKKDLRSVAASLSAVASHLPTQNVHPIAVQQLITTEMVVQFSFGLRKTQRRELQRLASDADMTMRAFILDALQAKGLTVTAEDLLDLRRKS